MNKGLAIYLARVVIERSLGLILFLIGSSWAISATSACWFVAYFAAAAAIVLLYRTNPEVMNQRTNIAATKDTTPAWDKILLTLFWLIAYFVVYYLAGRFFGAALIPWPLLIAGIALYVFSTLLTTWALKENRFAESTARLQKERGQIVCSSGPYAYVRHPMYSAILIWCVAIVLVFPCLAVGIAAGATAAIIIARTMLEDRMLTRGLPGYSEYRERTRFMLIPYVL